MSLSGPTKAGILAKGRGWGSGSGGHSLEAAGLLMQLKRWGNHTGWTGSQQLSASAGLTAVRSRFQVTADSWMVFVSQVELC